jgi:hypothetical protein
MSRVRQVILVATPMVAAATLALGLRIGARDAVRAALVYAAPPARAKRGFAWQVQAMREELGVREVLPLASLRVHARDGSKEATWTGSTNVDGVAEVWLDLPGADADDTVELSVESGETLAAGAVRVARRSGDGASKQGSLSPSRRDGAILLDVAVSGQKMTPGFPTSLWVRATDAVGGSPLGGIRIDTEPEPGLTFAAPSAVTCKNGWAVLSGTANGHVLGTGLVAKANDGREGHWFGALPVAGGSAFVAIPARVAPGAPLKLEAVLPTVRRLGYAEVDDEAGRAFAQTLSFEPDSGGFLRASIDLPPLADGTYWLVTSGEPRGAETLSGSAMARPFYVGDAPAGDPVCGAGPALAAAVGGPFARTLALDGFVASRAPARAKRERGRAIALSGLLFAALLEALLLVSGARSNAMERAREERALDGELRENVGFRATTLHIAIGVCVALLGFALLAAVVLYRS